MAYLLLADGTLFKGDAVGATKYSLGELVFNTSHLGYQEILTDPSYLGQIINFTSPHLGNIGINHENFESKKIHATGAIFRSKSQIVSHWKSQENLDGFLKKHSIPGLCNVDTRALTLHLRENGSQIGCLVTNQIPVDSAAKLIKDHNTTVCVSSVTTKYAYIYSEPTQSLAHVVVIDCGVKAGILASLKEYPIKITVAPATSSLEQLLNLNPDGILLSNGPGDPRDYSTLIQLTKALLEKQIPLFGICLGHQILALAAGGSIKKMKFGHHGANHPIQCVETGSVFISSQNHGYVVDEDLVPDCFKITHISLFDKTIAGLEHKNLPAFSFQGHPEANPGPRELGYLFNKFIQKVHYA